MPIQVVFSERQVAPAQGYSPSAAKPQPVVAAWRRIDPTLELVAPEAAPRLEQLRYRLYTLERAVGITLASLDRLAHAQLYVLVDGGSSAEDCAELARTLVEAGVDVLQFRDKRLDDRDLIERAWQELLRSLTREPKNETQTDTTIQKRAA